MYGESEWREARRLRADGMSKATIASRMGISRNTVDKLLKLTEAPRYKGSAKLTAYEEAALRTFARVLVEEAFLVVVSKRVSSARNEQEPK